MKRKSICFLIITAVLFSVSCTSAPVGMEESNIPSILLEPPVSANGPIGVGYAKLPSIALSIKVAETIARADIASQVKTTIQEAITAYAREAGIDDNTQLISFVEKITSQITDTTLNSAIIKSRDLMDDGGIW